MYLFLFLYCINQLGRLILTDIFLKVKSLEKEREDTRTFSC